MARKAFTRRLDWWLLAAAIALLMMGVALNNTIYDVTSPPAMDLHVLLRKLYSIAAFAVVGYPVARARMIPSLRSSPFALALGVAAIVALYSAVIEVLQFFFDPPPEGLLSNSVDLLCGFIGGLFGAAVALRWSGKAANYSR